MDQPTLKELNTALAEIAKRGINRRADLIAAVPLIVEAKNRLDSLNNTIKGIRKNRDAVSDAAAKYALEHRSVFNEIKILKGDIFTGDIEIGGSVYHLTVSQSGFVRTDPSEDLNQEFLGGLPQGWTKSLLHLDDSAVNKADPGDEYLASVGLMRKEKRTWSERTSID